MPGKLPNIFLRRPQLSFGQRFSLQAQNAVLTPAVSQIHSHRQTIPIGPTVFSLRSFLPLTDTARTSRAPLPVNFPSTSAITSFASRCTGPRDFVRFKVASLRWQDLLCFFKVDLLIL